MNIVSYGAGVNSTAMLVGMFEKGVPVDLILFADPGSEQPYTYEYLPIMDGWLARHRMPCIQTVYCTDRNGDRLTLEQECLCSGTLPAIAYGYKKCSLKHKAAPQDKFCNHYPPCREAWARGEKVVKYIGYELGTLYRDGLGGEADEERAARYFHQAFLGFQIVAASSPDDRLPYRVGWMLLHGVGTEQNEAAALPWLEKAAKGGNPFAKYQLGKLLLTGTDTVPKDTARALELLTNCAEDGNEYAQYTLGKAYLLGQDIPQDQRQAAHWLKLSAEQGNQYAKFFLDRVYGSIFSSAASLLYHMGRIFQEQRQPPAAGMRVAVDSKLRRKIREKKIAMGHKPDDHEEQAMG